MDDPRDRDLDSLWEILKILANVDDIPKVIQQVLDRNLEFSPTNIGTIIDDSSNRGVFNSPMHISEKKFKFDD
jgi:hypothetical protein